MNKKKGFTLIELIVTVALLAIIGTVIVVNMVSLNKKQQEKEKTRISSVLNSACESYIKVENKTVEDNKTVCIKTQDLIEKNYIKEGTVPDEYKGSSIKYENDTCTASLTNDTCVSDETIIDKTFTVKFYDDSTEIKTIRKTEKYGSTFTVPSYSKVGYDFKGWSKRKDTTNVTYKNGDKYTISGKNDNLYAVLKAKNYTITYHSNGGSTIPKETHQYKTTITAPKVPIKEGYNFVGWYKERSLKTAFNFNTMPAENLNLYAKWEAKPITLEIHGSIADKIIINNVTYDISDDGKTMNVEQNQLSKIKIHIKSEYQPYINRINIDNGNSSARIMNLKKDNEYLNFDINNNTSTVNINPYIEFNFYYPKNEEIAILDSISVHNSINCYNNISKCYAAESENIVETVTKDNVIYTGKTFKVYDIEKAEVGISILNVFNGNIEKSEYLTDMFNYSYNGKEYIFVYYNFKDALAANEEFVYINFQLKCYIYLDSWNGPANLKNYIWGIDITGGTTKELYDDNGYVNGIQAIINDPSKFKLDLEVIVHGEESEGSQLWSYFPTDYGTDMFKNITSEYNSHLSGFDGGKYIYGDTYIITYEGLTSNFKNNQEIHMTTEHFISGYSNGGATCYICSNYVNDECVGWTYVGGSNPNCG